MDLEREQEFLRSLSAHPDDAAMTAVYADALEEDGLGAEAAFLRLRFAMREMTADDARRLRAEEELSRLRKGIATQETTPNRVGDAQTWIDAIEPERAALRTDKRFERACACFTRDFGDDDDSVADEDDDDDDDDDKPPPPFPNPPLHQDLQDTESSGWKRLCAAVEEAAADRREDFTPLKGMTNEEVAEIVTLPPTIAKLTSVTRLTIYGSRLVRIPPEIGAMTNLTNFTPYTSYRLHWFPYEITRCKQLSDSTVSTRALYGNFKFRPPFPALTPAPPLPSPLHERPTRRCSVCDASFVDEQKHRVWISLRVATDVLPLLVNACSEACIAALPPGAEKYVPTPHRGGLGIVQPATEY